MYIFIFIYLFIYFIYLFIYLFILFILFIYLFIYLYISYLNFGNFQVDSQNDSVMLYHMWVCVRGCVCVLYVVCCVL